MTWTLAARAERMNPSVIREILKVTEKPGIISFAGGLPSPQTFPIEAFADACHAVLRGKGLGYAQATLQYAASEGYAPLREWVAQSLPWDVDPAQVLITTGSQQALDLIGKVLIDPDSKVLVESPTYLGALQAFAPMQPQFVGLPSDAEGVNVQALRDQAVGARFIYLLPNFQNPTGRSMSEGRRAQVVAACDELGLPFVEDNPYGDLWFGAPPDRPLTARNPLGGLYMGSFSKTLAPGLRLGFLVAPAAIYPKLLQAKQAADLHTPTFNQRVVAEVLQGGFIERHVPTIRALYQSQRDAMLQALRTHMPQGVSWNEPDGGMFLWVKLPAHLNAQALLPQAVERNVAFVPGAPFYAQDPQTDTLRLSFVTPSVAQIHTGIEALAQVIREALA